MSQSQEEFENQPKEIETITSEKVGSLEDVLGEGFFEDQ
jgi:hypothetical protein